MFFIISSYEVMKNIFSFMVAGVVLFTTLGCGLVSGLEDEAVNVAVGDKKVGIRECDEVIETFTKNLNDPDDGVIVKGAKRVALNQFRDELKRRLDENKANPQAVADFCREFGKNLADSSKGTNANRK
jgi:hypothetical protein